MRIFIEKKWVHILCCLCIIGGCLLYTACYDGTENAMFPMLDATIVLDAGHGGWDPGKTGTGGANEKELLMMHWEKANGQIWQNENALPMKAGRISLSAFIRMPFLRQR